MTSAEAIERAYERYLAEDVPCRMSREEFIRMLMAKMADAADWLWLVACFRLPAPCPMADDLIARCRRLLAQSDDPPVSIPQIDLAALIALAEPELQRIALSPRAASYAELDRALDEAERKKWLCERPPEPIALSPRAAHALDASVTPRSTWR